MIPASTTKEYACNPSNGWLKGVAKATKDEVIKRLTLLGVKNLTQRAQTPDAECAEGSFGRNRRAETALKVRFVLPVSMTEKERENIVSQVATMKGNSLDVCGGDVNSVVCQTVLVATTSVDPIVIDVEPSTSPAQNTEKIADKGPFDDTLPLLGLILGCVVAFSAVIAAVVTAARRCQRERSTVTLLDDDAGASLLSF